MDQLRKILAWLKQHHFWVLSVLVVVVGLFCWWRASGAMSKQYEAQKSTITAGFSTVGQVSNDTFHPNADVNQRQKEEINKLAEEVAKLWRQLYDLQSEKVLKWPSGPTELKPEFVETVEKLEFGAEIPDNLREHYQNYIYNHFPELPAIIGAQAYEEGQTGAGGERGFSRMPRGYSPEGPAGRSTTSGDVDDIGDYICQWVPEDQANVRDELEFPQTPSSLRVWCTQENLWVYRTMLEVIKNTNAAVNATRKSNAAVRVVYSLQCGQAAAPFSRTPNRIYKLPTATPAGEPGLGEFPTEGPGGAPVSEFPAGGGEFGRSALADGSMREMSEEQERAALLDGRYLGEDGKPVRLAGGGVDAGPDAAPVDMSLPAGPLDLTMFGKEYKRLPVRMVLEMDQRQIPRLIAECANRPLQIEVQEVRVNAPDILGGTSGPMSGMRSFEGSGPGGGSLMPDLVGLQNFNPRPEIVNVAVQGVIYIFNKPNEELLKPPTDGESFAANP